MRSHVKVAWSAFDPHWWLQTFVAIHPPAGNEKWQTILGILIQLFAVTVVLRLSLSRIFHVFPTHNLTSGPFVRQDVMRLFVPRADTEQCNSEIIIFHDRAYSSENHPGCEYLTKSTRPTFTVTSGSSLLRTHHRDVLDSQTTKKWKLKILNSTAGS